MHNSDILRKISLLTWMQVPQQNVLKWMILISTIIYMNCSPKLSSLLWFKKLTCRQSHCKKIQNNLIKSDFFFPPKFSQPSRAIRWFIFISAPTNSCPWFTILCDNNQVTWRWFQNMWDNSSRSNCRDSVPRNTLTVWHAHYLTRPLYNTASCSLHEAYHRVRNFHLCNLRGCFLYWSGCFLLQSGCVHCRPSSAK